MAADENAADSEQAVPTKYWVVLGVSAAILGAYWTWDFLHGAESPEALTARALSAGSSEERMQATAQLSLSKDPKVIRGMRRLLAESQDPRVQVAAIHRLSMAGDVESTLPFYAAMEHVDATVREAAYSAVLRSFGGALPESLEYLPSDAAEKRTKVTRQLKEIFQDGMAGKRRSETAVAAATPPVSPLTTPSPAPTPAAEVAPLMQPAAYPAIELVVWMCRLVALIVLVAVVAGAVNLLIGEKSPGSQRRDKTVSKNPQDELIAALLARSGTSTWTKSAMLVGGATLVVALLYAGELLHLAGRVEQTASRFEQSAIRVEQKLDYLKGR